jgi:hypothetical protein
VHGTERLAEPVAASGELFAMDDLARLRPPTVTDAEKALRRAVPMAYRISL